MRNVLETLPRSVIWVRMNNAQIFAVEEHEKIECWFWQQSKTETLSPLKTFYLHSSQQVHWSCIRITNNAQYLWREKHQYVFFLWLVQPVLIYNYSSTHRSCTQNDWRKKKFSKFLLRLHLLSLFSKKMIKNWSQARISPLRFAWQARLENFTTISLWCASTYIHVGIPI